MQDQRESEPESVRRSRERLRNAEVVEEGGGRKPQSFWGRAGFEAAALASIDWWERAKTLKEGRREVTRPKGPA